MRLAPIRIAIAVAVSIGAVVLFAMPLDGVPEVDEPAAWPLSAAQVAHVLVMAVVTVVWAWALPGIRLLWLLLLGVAFGAGAELLQHLPFVERTPRLRDFGLNALGVVVGAVFAAVWRRVVARRVAG